MVNIIKHYNKINIKTNLPRQPTNQNNNSTRQQRTDTKEGGSVITLIEKIDCYTNSSVKPFNSHQKYSFAHINYVDYDYHAHQSET